MQVKTIKKIPLIIILLILILIVIWVIKPKGIGNDNPLNGYKMKCFGYEYKKKSDFWKEKIEESEIYNYYCIGISYDYIEKQYNNGNTCFRIGLPCTGGE